MQPRQAIVETALPPGALLGRYEGRGGYADCFTVTVPGHVSQAAYVEAFYTTPLFKLERLALALLVARPSTDIQAHRLATGETDRFAAWTVEMREADQILLCDFQGATRSWLMSATEGPDTRLRFGTAIVPRKGAGRPNLFFRALTPFHRIYARALLWSAARRLRSAGTPA